MHQASHLLDNTEWWVVELENTVSTPVGLGWGIRRTGTGIQSGILRNGMLCGVKVGISRGLEPHCTAMLSILRKNCTIFNQRHLTNDILIVYQPNPYQPNHCSAEMQLLNSFHQVMVNG